jgi:aquaporin NIP
MKKYLAEFIGTFGLVFCGAGAVTVNEVTGGAITHVGVAISFGLIIMTMIYALGDISGAHFNPAVTLAFAVSKNFPWKEVGPYFLSQLAGAFLASGALRFIFPTADLMGTTLPAGTDLQSFVLEILLTFFLVFVILRVATGTKEQGMFAGLAIGGTILLDAMFGGPISGASMNPARSLAPAIVSGNIEHLWIYLTAPFMGALIAAIIYGLLKTKHD